MSQTARGAIVMRTALNRAPAPRDAPEPRHEDIAALMVSPFEQDHAALEQLFQKLGWSLLRAHTIDLALSLLRANPIPILISRRDLWLGDWRELLVRSQELQSPPLLVVASPQADGRLWADVLNAGGHDVLMMPFRIAEVNWVMRQAQSAWRHGRSNVAP
jgi:DNA-binding response OmpR family regulator